jgi:hypothetical protein
MKSRKIVAIVFITTALILGTVFYLKIEFPVGPEGYFKGSFYRQFGPLAISIELFIAGIYLFIKHSKTNFALALFGFTALLDPIFSLVNLFSSLVPVYAMILFTCCAIVSLWLAFSNTYELGRISFLGALFSFLGGSAIELYFNYLVLGY